MPLISHFVRAMPSDARVHDAEALEGVLRETLASARTRWPQIVVPDDVFIAHLAERIDPRTCVEDAIAEMATNDLYLACGCVLGRVEAFRALDDHHFPRLESALSRSGFDTATIADVIQELRTSLLVPQSAEPPRLAKYGGKGKLLGWLRVVARREASAKHGHDRAKEVELDEDLLEKMLPIFELEPELDAVRRESRAIFTRAFTAAFAALPAGERTRQSIRSSAGWRPRTRELVSAPGCWRAHMRHHPRQQGQVLGRRHQDANPHRGADRCRERRRRRHPLVRDHRERNGEVLGKDLRRRRSLCGAVVERGACVDFGA